MTCRRIAPRARGFTLVEMLVATAISAVVIAGGLALLLSQERLFRSSSGTRSLQETARVALGELSGSIRRAGLGVDPPLALDFGAMASVTQPMAAPAGGLAPSSAGYLCDTPVTCRDRIDGADEIVFYARDPLFGHKLTKVDGATSISISGPLRTTLYPGQILQLMCMRSAMYSAYVTVGTQVDPDLSGTTIAVTLAGASKNEFPYQNQALSDPSVSECFTDGTAWVAKVDRYRYFVQNFDPTGKQVGLLDPGGRPYLMLDQGLSDKKGPIWNIVAPDVEDVQFAYVFPNNAPASQVVGATQSTRIAAGASGIDLAAASAGYGTAIDDPVRSTAHPSNIRAVRVSLVVRTPTADPKIADATVPAAANRPAIKGPAGFRRLLFETTVFAPNLEARAPFYPFHSLNSGADHLNVGGS